MTLMPVDQNAVFRDGEGDAWFRRNARALSVKHPSDRTTQGVLHAIAKSSAQSLCEVGCSNGWRLALLSTLHPGLRLAGFDVSAAAIAAGRAEWPTLDLAIGSADAPPFDKKYDLVILSFVLHWVSRSHLACSIAAIDGLIRDGGLLVLTDFLPDAPCARRYHHRPDLDLFTYKQDYVRCFTALETYHLESHEVFSYSNGTTNAITDDQDRAVCAILRRDLARSSLIR